MQQFLIRAKKQEMTEYLEQMVLEELRETYGNWFSEYITDLATFAVFAVAPFNLLKGFLVSVIVLLIYKKISPILKMGN